LLEDISSFRADYINPGNVKKSNPKTSKSSSDTVKCPQCSLRIHRNLIKTHRKFYHDTQMMLPGEMETRDKGRKKFNFGFTKSKVKTINMKKNGISSKSCRNIKNMWNEGDGLCSIQRRNNLETNQIKVVELDKDEVIEIVDDDDETTSIDNNKLPGDENEAIEIVDEEEDTFANNNKAGGMTMEITTADIVPIYASELKTSSKCNQVEVVTIAEDDNCENTVNHDKSTTLTRMEITTNDMESTKSINRKPPSLNNHSLDVDQSQSQMCVQFPTSILSQTSYGSFKDSHQSVPLSKSDEVSTSSKFKEKVTDSTCEEEDLDCTLKSSITTRNVAPCNNSLGGRRGLEGRSRSY